MYNVVENVAETFEHIAKAHHVLAFCGVEMYVIKCHSPHPPASPLTPRKPDLVIGIYLNDDGELESRKIRLRTKS